MSGQLAALPLTFNWQIAKQTHGEPAGSAGQSVVVVVVVGAWLIECNIAAVVDLISGAYKVPLKVGTVSLK